MKHFLALYDFSADELNELLNLADRLKYERKNGISHRVLEGKSLGMIFEKSSTRTRVSFEVGMMELGGYPLYLNSSDMQLSRGEPIEDTARVLSRYLSAIMIRTFEHEKVEALAKFGSIPIINGLTDYAHPCQVLADLMTIREKYGKLAGLKLTFVGDGNNMANSLMVGCVKMGMSFAIACPKGYEPDAKLIKWAKENGDVLVTDDVKLATEAADVVYTDVWASMGQENEKQKREKDFLGFQVNSEVMSLAKQNAMVLHCLPAHRGEEITADIFENHADEIFEEAENRLHAQKAILVSLLKK